MSYVKNIQIYVRLLFRAVNRFSEIADDRSIIQRLLAVPTKFLDSEHQISLNINHWQKYSYTDSISYKNQNKGGPMLVCNLHRTVFAFNHFVLGICMTQCGLISFEVFILEVQKLFLKIRMVISDLVENSLIMFYHIMICNCSTISS